MTDEANLPTLPETPGPANVAAVATPDGRYTMQHLLGRGGMGEVWLAHDARIDRDVAIKLMKGGANEADRFLREARVQGRLEHPCIVPVHDIGGGASPYFVMKRLAGTTLALAIRKNGAEPWTRRTLLARFIDVCLAMELAHQRGVIHRDLKPANIMLGDFGETYVLDWGLARVVGASADAGAGAVRTDDLRNSAETMAGTVLGTPLYMAPEQARAEPVDHRADIYALGCVLFEILVGAPARERSLQEAAAPACYRPSAKQPDVAPELDELCARATAADPAVRMASARELANGVQRYLDGDRDLARRRELSAEHAARAKTLVETAGDGARSEAMREAGRALALDAGNRTAQQVLGRLLIEPPKEIPAAAREKLEREKHVAMHAIARVSLVSYPAFLLLLATLVLFVGMPLTVPIAVVGVLLMVQTAMGVRFANPRHAIPSWAVPVAGSLHVALVALTGMIFGTLLVLPMLAFGSLPALLLLPARRASSVVMAAQALGLAIPLTLEVSGMVPRSYKIVGDSIVVRPWAVHLEPTTLLIGILFVIAIQLVANYVILGRLRRTQDRAQEQLHVQSWQLEQLVVDAESTGPKRAP